MAERRRGSCARTAVTEETGLPPDRGASSPPRGMRLDGPCPGRPGRSASAVSWGSAVTQYHTGLQDEMARRVEQRTPAGKPGPAATTGARTVVSPGRTSHRRFPARIRRDRCERSGGGAPPCRPGRRRRPSRTYSGAALPMPSSRSRTGSPLVCCTLVHVMRPFLERGRAHGPRCPPAPVGRRANRLPVSALPVPSPPPYHRPPYHPALRTPCLFRDRRKPQIT